MTFFEMFDAAKADFSKADVSGFSGNAAAQITVTGDGEGIFYAAVTNGVLDVQPYDYKNNTAAVTLSRETLFALLKREIALTDAVAAELAAVTGSMDFAAALFAAVPVPAKKDAPKKAATTKKTAAKKAETAAPVKETEAKAETKTAAKKTTKKAETATTTKAAAKKKTTTKKK